MRIVVAVHGTRGDVEPCAAVARELRTRGHEVKLAVPPNLIGFVESVGLGPAAAYGVDSQKQVESEAFQNYWKVKNPVAAIRDGIAYYTDGWADMNATLTDLAADADIILTGTTYQEVAANVAEHYDIPMAALHYFPARPNSHLLPLPLPSWAIKPGFAVGEWALWRLGKSAEDAQRRTLGLPATTIRSAKRIVAAGALEIQAYDPTFFPGLDQEWGGSRPLVGGITLQLETAVDDEVMSWIGAGTPPIYFGFGSMPVRSPADAVAMITDVCAELGERALISAGVWELDQLPEADHVKLVGAVNHSAVFPACRAVVHHGGAGTTAAGARAGVPTLVLWVSADQPVWARAVRKLRIGTSQRFTSMTKKSLTTALRAVLDPDVARRARDFAAGMTTPAQSVATAADLIEHASRAVQAG
ncbi:glycosyltransferase [Mycolicibacterium sp. 120266]|uniref:glycosyltransferase n=1 Tax=Mycolicibacterium sp. 120266 TaxID=3090601 RepID=UPI00299D9CC9|nr:glycosyltransferase [Mycolicibacterium sp. 120266]MDX1872723.1 glycosyltransferase [Mycolicibacterium sp. 120266]